MPLMSASELSTDHLFNRVDILFMHQSIKKKTEPSARGGGLKKSILKKKSFILKRIHFIFHIENKS